MNQLDDRQVTDSDSVLDLLSELVNRFRVSDHVITYCNAAWAKQYGADGQTVIGRRLDDFLSPDELHGLRTQLDLLGPDRPVIVDPVARSVPGESERWLAWVDRYVVTDNGPEVLSVGRDVTDRHLAELRLCESENRFRCLAENASDIVWRVRFDPSVHFDYMSPSVEHLLGYPPSFFLNEFERVFDISEPETRTLIRRSFRGERLPERLDLRFRHADGSVVVGETSTTFDRTSAHGVIRDVTELRRLQAIITAQALCDPLTGISNRRRFDQLLDSELERTAQSGTVLAVAYIDLDGLKQINDQHGHATGDIVLQEAARRLERIIDPADMLARLGGDEYAIIFEPTNIAACQLRLRIRALFDTPIVISDTLTIQCNASVGIADTTSAGRNANDLVAAADHAMYDDKHDRQLG